jgi:hypothetical protein
MHAVNSLSPYLFIPAGFLVCFFGYRLLRITLGLAGFGVGFWVGTTVVHAVPGAGQVLLLVVGIVCGILGALAASLLYKVGVFLVGAGAGIVLAGILITVFAWHYPVLICVVAAVIGGLLTLLLERVLVSVLTALAGAWGVVFGVGRLLGGQSAAGRPPEHLWLLTAAWAVTAILGMAVQLRGKRRDKKQED